MKRWMIANKGRRFIMLHLNDDSVPFYKRMKRVPNWVIKLVRGNYKWNSKNQQEKSLQTLQ